MLMAAVAVFSFLAVWHYGHSSDCVKPTGGKENARLAEPLVMHEAEQWAGNLPATTSGAGLRFSAGQAGPVGLMVEVLATGSGETLTLLLVQDCDGGEWRVVARQAGL